NRIVSGDAPPFDIFLAPGKNIDDIIFSAVDGANLTVLSGTNGGASPGRSDLKIALVAGAALDVAFVDPLITVTFISGTTNKQDVVNAINATIPVTVSVKDFCI